MAVIGSIRKQSTLLVIIIGVALAAFVLGDFAKGGGASREENIGIVDGEVITNMEFNRKVEQNIEATKQQQQKDRLDPDATYRLKNDTWDQMVSDILLKNEYRELGLGVTADELFDLVQGPNPHQLIKQYFADPQTGIYDRNLIIQYLKNLDNLPADAKLQWINFEQFIKSDRLQNKYNTLISQGYYWPKALAQLNYEENNNKAKIVYVSRKYVDIADTIINPSDADYKKQYDLQKENFKQEAWKDIDYVVFDITPSQKDMIGGKKDIDAIYEDFKTTIDLPRFVLVTSDQPYDSTWKTEGQLPVQIDSIMFNSEIGRTVEPYLISDTYYTSRLADVAFRPDSLKASHILIAFRGAFRAAETITRSREEANAVADSLSGLLQQTPGDLKALAGQFSDDPSVQNNNGDMGWFLDGYMVTSFNEAVIDNEVGSVVVVESPFGFHVISVDDKTEALKKVRVGTIVREVVPSNETYQQTYAKASKLASENQNLTDFNIAVEDERLNKRTAPKVDEMDNNIPGLNFPRQIIRWAYGEDAEVGEVSEVFDLEGQFVVAVITAAGEEGYPDLEDVRTRLNPFVYSDLKAQMIIKEVSAEGNDMETLVSQNGFAREELDALVFTTRNLQGFGQENSVIGSVFGMDEGSEYGPVEGRGGVFLLKLDNVVKVDEKDSYDDLTASLVRTWKSRVDQGFAYKALENASDVEDNRHIFY